VNIAVALVADAFLDKWDTAFVVSGDSDLVPPILAIREHLPHKTVVVISPLNRHSAELWTAAGANRLNAKMPNYRDCQLPDEVMKGTFPLTRPDKWN